MIRVRCQAVIEKDPYGHVLIHDRTTAEIVVIEMDYAERLRSIPKADFIISYNLRKIVGGMRTYAHVRMISFSSVSSVYFPCISSRICFKRSILCTKHENKKNKKKRVPKSVILSD